MSVEPTGSSTTVSQPPPVGVTPDKGNITAFDDPDGPSFSDFLDIINPLQHIPIVNTIYRHLTGDEEGAVADVVGGALYGGIIGIVAAEIDLMVKDLSGKRIGDNIVALFTDDDPAVKTAEAPPAAAETPTRLSSVAETVPAAAAVPDENAGPVRAGDYLVFGGAPSMAATLPAAAPAPAPAPAPAKASPRLARQDTIDESGPMRRGDYLVFGANNLPAAASVEAVSVSALPGKSFDGTAGSIRPRPGTNGDARAWAAPSRTGPATARQVLPPPTTGPGALPGGHSTAASNRDGGNDQWFVGAFTQAMDKYQRASRLGGDKGSGDAVQPATMDSGSQLIN